MKDEFAVRVEVRREVRRTKRMVRRTQKSILEVIDSSSRATQSLFQETQTQMRVQHEDLVQRILRIGEGGPGRA